MAKFLAFAGAVVFGAADFLGGLASRRWAAIPVVLVSQTVGGVLLLFIMLVLGDPFPLRDFAIGAIAGVLGFGALIVFFRALEGGVMSIVAPTTSAVAGLLPVTAGLILFGEQPGPFGIVGAAIALIAIVLLSTSETANQSALTNRQSLILAIIAGAGFGSFFVVIGQTEISSGLWPLAGARAVSIPVGIALLMATGSGQPRNGAIRIAIFSGVLDMAGNILTLLALQRGLLSLIGVLASLYPASTVILARIVLHEDMTRKQLSGIVLALVGVALISTA
ncbi:MAG: DMT family transporter [Acidimicrobiia bacterium]|nr:DMT family transporter [Acidimicrobiia bacterium]